jgi:LPXTG-motif cell wall-anchored protein
LQNQISNIKTQVSNIDTKQDGLISQEDKIRGLLSDIEKLTKEEQSILQTQIDLLNSLLGKSTTLKEQVENLKEMINSLPAADKITKQDSENINKIYELYSNFTNEQKKLLGEDLIKLLSGATDVLNKLMLHDAKTDITVMGIDGTSFTPDVYLVVTPIKVDGTSAAKFSSASVSVESAAKNISQLEGKELLALYDVSLFRDNIKIQPNGKVKVKIKIPDNLINSTGLDIVHISDDGRVTPMNATVEDGYLVFITTHFSDYAIVGKAITKEIPKTGSTVDLTSLVIGGILLSLLGLVLIRKQNKKS